MRHLLLILAGLLLPASALAVDLTVLDPCGEEPWLTTNSSMELPATLGAVTVDAFDRAGIPYLGNEQGVHQIRDSLIGDAALEIVSDSEMRAYGWCYMLDGSVPAGLTHQIKVYYPHSSIVWFFGYAHYLDGEWIANCVPTHEIQPDYICSQ